MSSLISIEVSYISNVNFKAATPLAFSSVFFHHSDIKIHFHTHIAFLHLNVTAIPLMQRHGILLR